MKMLMAPIAIVAVAITSAALAQGQSQAPHKNQSNEGIQSPTQQQRLDGGAIIPHGESGRDTVNLGGHGDGSEGVAPATQGQGSRRDIIKNNESQGRDPDPRVRQELRRDPRRAGRASNLKTGSLTMAPGRSPGSCLW
jgi:hypothetical protein